MFFRREKPRVPSFQERLEALRTAGFTVDLGAQGTARAHRTGCAVNLEENGAEPPKIGKCGVVFGQEIAYLVNQGYQQVFVTPTGRKFPAQSFQLRALHDFQEDLKEALGLESLYNESLGTTSTKHLYDRVKDRDHGVPRRPWEEKRNLERSGSGS